MTHTRTHTLYDKRPLLWVILLSLLGRLSPFPSAVATPHDSPDHERSDRKIWLSGAAVSHIIIYCRVVHTPVISPRVSAENLTSSARSGKRSKMIITIMIIIWINSRWRNSRCTSGLSTRTILCKNKENV